MKVGPLRPTGSFSSTGTAEGSESTRVDLLNAESIKNETMLCESTAGRLADVVKLSEPRELGAEGSWILLLSFHADCLWSNMFISAEKHHQHSKSEDVDFQVCHN